MKGKTVSRPMSRILCILIAVTVLFSCRDRNIPDVSDIDVKLEVQRFEEDFFAIDTMRVAEELQRLRGKYPLFISDFTYNILGLPPVSDSGTEVQAAIRQFISDYKPVRDSVARTFKDIDEIAEDVKEGLRFVKHYFPTYPLPVKLITFIGPMDAYFEGSLGGYGDAITADALAVGLQLHLGSDFSMYHTEMGQALFPAYISRRFSPEYIPVNCMKNIIDDLYPDNSSGMALVEQMVEKGKRVYLLDLLLPRTHDTLKLGYTSAQLEGCENNEGLIFNFFLTNSLLYKSDPGITKNYIGEAPSTQELGEGSPGNIGLFVGRQIIRKYLEKNNGISPDALMQTDPKTIFEQSGYRPR